jgi:hypothetical protein
MLILPTKVTGLYEIEMKRACRYGYTQACNRNDTIMTIDVGCANENICRYANDKALWIN